MEVDRRIGLRGGAPRCKNPSCVPETRRAGFAAECRRQSELAAHADRDDGELWEFLDEALAKIVESP